MKRVLFAPLNWGLGHATRCIPLIEKYIADGWEVILASDGLALEYLQMSFPQLECHELPGYDIRYSSNSSMAQSIVRQLPKLLTRIRDEYRWTKKFLAKEHLDLIISDNRYGIRSRRVHSVMISHQLCIKSPVFEGLLNRFNKQLLERFHECWVPDHEGEANLSGEMSAIKLSIPVKFIGPLSSLKQNKNLKKEIPVLCILSGPEPLRTDLEEEIYAFLNSIPGAVLVRGVKGRPSAYEKEGLRVFDFATRNHIQDLLSKAEAVICRSGYSSIMDLEVMKIPALLIPTPGQPEQEYLAERMAKRSGYSACSQKDLNEVILEEFLSPPN